jgi:hypothetical protein
VNLWPGTSKNRNHNALHCHKGRGEQFRQASDWLQLKKKNPTLATCDILQHLGHFGVQRVCHLDGAEPNIKKLKMLWVHQTREHWGE